MERSLAFLKKVMLRTQSMRKVEVARKMGENFELLNEVNELRTEKKANEVKLLALQRQVQYQEQQLIKLDRERMTLARQNNTPPPGALAAMGGGNTGTPPIGASGGTGKKKRQKSVSGAQSLERDAYGYPIASSPVGMYGNQSRSPSPAPVKKEYIHIAKPAKALPSLAPPRPDGDQRQPPTPNTKTIQGPGDHSGGDMDIDSFDPYTHNGLEQDHSGERSNSFADWNDLK
eukprot:GFYU01010271.1.p1 GENE.GFYU01010271.1~~GFYU01010271.1.p1  ORF type:complete len:231 (-),score=51.39 GFYU01010271.1:108-800(-)